MPRIPDRAALLPLPALFFSLLLCAAARAQQPSLVGEWRTQQGPITIVLLLKADGTGTFDDEKISYAARGDKLIVEEGGSRNAYTFRLEGDTLTLTGGDIEGAMTFVRQGAAAGIGARARQRAAEAAASGAGRPEEKRNPLVGRWQSSEATVQINNDGTLLLNGERLRYAVRGSVITLSNSEGSLDIPFRLSGDTLTVKSEGRTIIYKRLAEGEEPRAAAGGAHPQELTGKWCYMANVNTGSGGRISNRCFTLYPNGTYEYYGETSSSGPVASSASQESGPAPALAVSVGLGESRGRKVRCD
ncbi:MAG: hypothetical protein LC785_07135 [Acidobacteria bacterium]|nr:hypothetical protein [Acidobacteriota bacterium]